MLILLTGSTGFLGLHLLNYLLKNTQKPIKSVYRSEEKKQLCIFSLKQNFEISQSQLKKIKWEKADICDFNSMEAAIQDCTEIYHTAAIVSFAKKDKKKLMETNGKATAQLVNLALAYNVKKFGYVSSVSTLSTPIDNTETINEDDFWKPKQNNSWYAISKYMGEREVWRGHAEGLNTTIVNPSMILGYTNNWHNNTGKLFQEVYNSFPYFTCGTTGWVSAGDVAKSLVKLLENNNFGQRYILNAENQTYQYVLYAIADALKVAPPNRKVSKTLANLVLYASEIKSVITNTTPMLTREIITNAFKDKRFDGSKIEKALPTFTYTSINDVIKPTANSFLKYIAEKQSIV